MFAKSEYTWDKNGMEFKGTVIDSDGEVLCETDDASEYLKYLRDVEIKTLLGESMNKEEEEEQRGKCCGECENCRGECDEDEPEECEETEYCAQIFADDDGQICGFELTIPEIAVKIAKWGLSFAMYALLAKMLLRRR